MTSDKGNSGERFTGHGPEWTDSNLSPEDARTATVWVEQKIDKRSMLTNKDRVEDVRDAMWQLEKDGEIALIGVCVDVNRMTGHRQMNHGLILDWAG